MKTAYMFFALRTAWHQAEFKFHLIKSDFQRVREYQLLVQKFRLGFGRAM